MEKNMKPNPIILPPDYDEITARRIRLQEKMSEEGLDYYVCQNPDNVFYLTNFANFIHERPFILLIPAEGSLIFLMPKLEEPHVKIRSVGEIEYVNYFEFPAPEGEQWSDKLKALIPNNSRVGVEHDCPLYLYQSLSQQAVCNSFVDDLRMVKSAYELGRLAYASEVLSEGHAQLLSRAKPDEMVLLIHSEVSKAMIQKVLMDNPEANMLATNFAAVCQPPGLSDDPHNFTNSFVTMAEGGPHVTVVSGRVNGYGAEVERTFFLGDIPEKAKQPFEDMLEARELAFELTKPGENMSEVDRRVNELLKSKGYGENLLHRTGHSFGVTNHEGPFLAEGYQHTIQPNMVFSIEPGIYLPGVGGFRFSDTVLVTETGNLSLTTAPTSLKDLILDIN